MESGNLKVSVHDTNFGAAGGAGAVVSADEESVYAFGGAFTRMGSAV